MAFTNLSFTSADELAALENLARTQAQAALMLGRLSGRLGNLSVHAAHGFAARIIRDALISALTQEGHRFTETRFAAWYAGLTTLSDEPLRFAPPARGLAEAVLSELACSHWEPLANTALQIQAALLAPPEPADAEARTAARAALDEATAIVSSVAADALPFPGLATIHQAISQSVRFALAERTPELFKLDNLQLVLERERPPSPRWPLELAFGSYLHASDFLPAALPMIGAIRLDAAGNADVPHRTIQAEALGHALASISKALDASAAIDADTANLLAKLRASSRAPQLYVLLRAFGPLRTAQIEAMLGVTRLGVRSMLRVLLDANILDAQTIAGSKLYSARTLPACAMPQQQIVSAPIVFSQSALAEYDASMADIDALLARHPSNGLADE